MAAGKLDLSKFRNLGIIAHIDAGKTTTTEHLLYYAGATHHLGAVDSGNTITDWNEEEQERGITIYSACIPFKWGDCTINLIDTPGHVDFTAEVERSLRVLDGCVVVFDAQKGVEAQSETVWRQADRYAVPRLVFVNKMDVVGANFEATLESIRKRLKGRPVPVTVPIGSGSPKDSATPFAGVIDLIEMEALSFDPADEGKTYRREPIPGELKKQAQIWRDRLLDELSMADEQDRITSAYLEGKEVPKETIRQVIREQTLKRLIQPVLAGSGREHIGIQPLLDAATWYLPSPLDRPPVVGQSPKKKDKEEKRKPDPKEPFAGLVFKIVASTHAELYYLRIYSGTLKSNSRVYNPGREGKELVGKLYHTRADPNDREELSESQAGDIVALIGLKEAITGDTLCETQHPILLERINFAQSVFSLSIEPESSADKKKLTDVLNLLAKEDPTFTWGTHKDTGQTLMNGMGKLHLEIKRHRMERDFHLKVRVGKPSVSYRETLRSPIRVEGECIKHAGAGGGLFAKVTVELAPHHGEEAVEVATSVKPDELPPALLAAAEQGVRGALDSGALGFPVMNVRATIVGGQFDPELSNDTAFTAARADAVQRAMRDNLRLLEPWMKLEVRMPPESMGRVIDYVGAKGGEVQKCSSENAESVVEAFVPVAGMYDYADELRSLTGGRAAAMMEPFEFRPAPDEVLRRLLHPEEFY
jgi:elongation factor G